MYKGKIFFKKFNKFIVKVVVGKGGGGVINLFIFYKIDKIGVK